MTPRSGLIPMTAWKTWLWHAGRTLGPTHWVNRLEDTVERIRQDGTKLIAGNEQPGGLQADE